MQHYVGLDVSVKETSVCIVDKVGKVIREVKVATKPVPILAVLTEEAVSAQHATGRHLSFRSQTRHDLGRRVSASDVFGSRHGYRGTNVYTTCGDST